MAGAESIIGRASVRTWYYVAPTFDAIYPIPARIPENFLRGDAETAGGFDPRWVSSEGGLRILGAVVVLSLGDLAAVIGHGRMFIPVYRDAPRQIATVEPKTRARVHLLGGAIVARGCLDPSFAYTLGEFLRDREIELPMRRATSMGDRTTYLMNDIWRSNVRRRRVPYFDAMDGSIVEAFAR